MVRCFYLGVFSHMPFSRLIDDIWVEFIRLEEGGVCVWEGGQNGQVGGQRAVVNTSPYSQVCVESWGCGMVCLECCCVNQSKASVMQIFQMIKRNHSCPDVSVWCHRTCGIFKSLEEGLRAETFTSTSCVPLVLEQKRGCHGNVDFKVFSSKLLKSVHYPIWMILGY